MFKSVLCACAAGALALATLTPAQAGVPSAAVTSRNLIRNGNAESAAGSPTGGVVPVPVWRMATGTGFTAVQYGASGGFPSLTDPGPPNRGANFLAGGPNDGLVKATQSRRLTAYVTSIDAGTATFIIKGYLGGFSSQEDNATLTATFKDAGGTTLAAATIGPVTATDRGGATGLLAARATGPIPVGARTVALALILTRQAGTYNDGYADNLSLQVRTPAAG